MPVEEPHYLFGLHDPGGQQFLVDAGKPGSSVVSFLSYFISRPLQALAHHLTFITRLGIIYHTDWARLVYAMDQGTVQQGPERCRMTPWPISTG